ncbi:MAG: hypothetical protein WCO06_00885 [Candidatus Roizmanbacteria bacterium]
MVDTTVQKKSLLRMRPSIHFETQGEKEEVVLVLRAHLITQIPWIINAFFFCILVVLFDWVFASYLSNAQLFFFNLITGIIIFNYFWWNVMVYYFNVGIITTERIIDVDLYSILYREVTEARNEHIQECTAKMGGYASAVFNYGNIFVETAGNIQNIEFLNTPYPSEVVKIINDLVEHTHDTK